MEPERIALANLPRWMHRLGVANAAARKVFERLVAVKPGLVGTYLSEPWPHFVRGPFDLDGMGEAPRRLRHQVVARIRPGGFLGGEAPVTARSAPKRREWRSCHDRDAGNRFQDVAS